jgi:hypothetical protein
MIFVRTGGADQAWLDARTSADVVAQRARAGFGEGRPEERAVRAGRLSPSVSAGMPAARVAPVRERVYLTRYGEDQVWSVGSTA